MHLDGFIKGLRKGTYDLFLGGAHDHAQTLEGVWVCSAHLLGEGDYASALVNDNGRRVSDSHTKLGIYFNLTGKVGQSR